MRKLIPLLIVGYLGVTALFSQDATLTSPVTHATETKYKIRNFNVSNPPGGTASAGIDLSIQDASNNELSIITRSIPGCGTATVAGLVTAMVTVRATETGTDVRKMQFRVIGYLFDQGCLPAATLNP